MKTLFKGVVIIAVIAIYLTVSKTGAKAANNLYGMYWRMATLAEIDINKSNTKVDIRFRASYTGNISSIVGFWGIANGYGGGTGGTIKCDVNTDDGTSQHLPSGNVIGGFTVNNAASVLHFVNQSTQQAIESVSFSSQPSVTAGNIYHVVCSNPASNPSTDWWSLNCIGNFVPSSPVQPIGDIENAAVYFDGSTWHNPYSEYTPIFTLNYASGNKQGMPYMQRDTSFKIYGNSKMYQSFKVSGSSKTATSVSVAMVRTGNPGALTVSLQTSSGTVIEQGTIPASAFVTNDQDPRWGTYTFSSPQTLAVGSSYRVVFNATGDGSNYYQTWVVQPGNSYSLVGDNFTDSQFPYYSTDGSTWKSVLSASGNYDDMMMYFTLSGSAPAAILGDLNSDNLVNLTDFNIIKTDFLKLASQLTSPKSDIDGDGQATIKDIGIMMSNWK